MTISTVLTPRVAEGERFELTQERPDVWRVHVRSGFMERLNIDDLLPSLKSAGCIFDADRVVYYVGHETIVRAGRGRRVLDSVTEPLFAIMERNQAHLSDVLGLPHERVVEIGRHIDL